MAALGCNPGAPALARRAGRVAETGWQLRHRLLDRAAVPGRARGELRSGWRLYGVHQPGARLLLRARRLRLRHRDNPRDADPSGPDRRRARRGSPGAGRELPALPPAWGLFLDRLVRPGRAAAPA